MYARSDRIKYFQLQGSGSTTGYIYIYTFVAERGIVRIAQGAAFHVPLEQEFSEILLINDGDKIRLFACWGRVSSSGNGTRGGCYHCGCDGRAGGRGRGCNGGPAVPGKRQQVDNRCVLLYVLALVGVQHERCVRAA